MDTHRFVISTNLTSNQDHTKAIKTLINKVSPDYEILYGNSHVDNLKVFKQIAGDFFVLYNAEEIYNKQG